MWTLYFVWWSIIAKHSESLRCACLRNAAKDLHINSRLSVNSRYQSWGKLMTRNAVQLSPGDKCVFKSRIHLACVVLMYHSVERHFCLWYLLLSFTKLVHAFQGIEWFTIQTRKIAGDIDMIKLSSKMSSLTDTHGVVSMRSLLSCLSSSPVYIDNLSTNKTRATNTYIKLVVRITR